MSAPVVHSQRVVRRAGLASLFIGLAVCAHGARVAVPVASTAELASNLERARTRVDAYTADVRLTYFGAKGRLRGTASLAVRRPSSLRYEVFGPHGGVVAAFATNGRELQAADFAASRFVYGPATVENLDQLFGIAPMHLDAAGWVSLLFGQITVPEGAALSRDPEGERYVVGWEEGGQTRRVEVDAATFRVVKIVISRGAEVLSEAEVGAWDGRGLPEALHLRVPKTGDDVEIKLREVTHDPALDPAVFVLDLPRGLAPEHLDPLRK
ncbi:MAG: DUF4292 domain-containing protein [Deltaproteobacteria bacterium]|nr:DUF4292 domain-containing protein [Deltaproteobacteria bacterium]